MKVLITGVSGLLGKYLIQNFPKNWEIFGVSKNLLNTNLINMHKNLKFIELDLLVKDKTLDFLQEVKPNFIVHCAAEGDVDQVQGKIKQHYRLNVGTPGSISKWAFENKVNFIFISSNAIYSGNDVMYDENSEANPINDYGILKFLAEKKVNEVNNNLLIIRPILMYGIPFINQRNNLVVNWIKKLNQNVEVQVVDDIYTQPLFAKDCANIIKLCIEKNLKGSLNISGGKTISLYDFAMLVSDVFNLDKKLP